MTNTASIWFQSQELFPAWMFSAMFINKVADLHQSKDSSAERGNPAPTSMDILMAAEPQILFDRHLKETNGDDARARQEGHRVQRQHEILLAHKIHLLQKFSGLKQVDFAHRVGWNTSGRKAPFMAQLYTGDAKLSNDKALRLIDAFHLDESWLYSDSIFSINCNNHYTCPPRLFDIPELQGKAIRVLHGDITLRDIGIATGGPSWIDPYCIALYAHQMTQHQGVVSVPNLFDKPHGIPTCSWDDIAHLCQSLHPRPSSPQRV